jgi:hypothetical protein
MKETNSKKQKKREREPDACEMVFRPLELDWIGADDERLVVKMCDRINPQ